jgi:hypothetical protein
MTTPAPAAEAARRVHADLLAKLADVETRQAATVEKRKAHAFKGLAENNRYSRQQLAELDAQSLTLANEREALGFAIDEAHRRIDEAEADHIKAERAEIARQIRALVSTLIRHAQDADEHAESLCRSFQALTDTLADLRGLGARHPEHHLVKTHTVWALTTALSAVPLGLAPVPVPQRRSLGYLANAWAQSIRRQSDAIEQGDARAPISVPPEEIGIAKVEPVSTERRRQVEEVLARRDLMKQAAESRLPGESVAAAAARSEQGAAS